MRKTLDEFKKFAMRGNVIDLAVGLVIGTAFNTIISSLVANVMMPLLGIVTGGNNLSGLHYAFKSADIHYGMFLQSILDFIIVAFALFLTIKLINRFKKEEEAASPAAPTKQEVLLTEIRDLLKK
jgi:large conductance mechanosensitive channel